MSIRTRDAYSVEDQASALLLALSAAAGRDFVRTFEALTSGIDNAVSGHAWRAIKTAIGSHTAPGAWQRCASPEAVEAMLTRASSLAGKPRAAGADMFERRAHADGIAELGALSAMASKVDAYVAARLRGVPHAKLGKYRIEDAGEGVRCR